MYQVTFHFSIGMLVNSPLQPPPFTCSDYVELEYTYLHIIDSLEIKYQGKWFEKKARVKSKEKVKKVGVQEYFQSIRVMLTMLFRNDSSASRCAAAADGSIHFYTPRHSPAFCCPMRYIKRHFLLLEFFLLCMPSYRAIKGYSFL